MLFVSAQSCMYYLALEPFVRRRWPWRVVAWNRLLELRWRDPLVGRDVLIGTAFGATIYLCDVVADRLPGWLGRPPTQPFWLNYPKWLENGPQLVLPTVVASALIGSLSFFLLFFFFYLLTRREWLAALAFIAFRLITVHLLGHRAENRDVYLVVDGVVSMLMMILIMRYGLLASVASALVMELLCAPLTFERGLWLSGHTLIYLAALVAVVGYGFVVASGGQALAWVRYVTGEVRTNE